MRKRLIFLIILVLGIVSFSLGQNLEIKEIEIVNNREVPNHVIISIMENKKGKVFSTENMMKDYKKIKETNYFETVNINPKPYLDGVKLLVEVQEIPNISNLLKERGVVSKKNLGSSDKVLVSNVNVVGNKNISSKEILNFVEIIPGQYYDKETLLASFQKLISSGWFQKIEPKVYESTAGIVVVFEVLENPIVRGVNISGNTLIKSEDLEKILTNKTGKVLNINNVRSDGENILASYQKAGYTLANIKDINLSKDNKLNIVIVEGVIKEIKIKKMATKQKGKRRVPNDNNLRTEEYIIRRELEIKEGEIFNIDNYENSLENLMRLGHFKNIKREVFTTPENPNEVTIVLLIDEVKTATINGTFSYGTETGASVAGSLKETNLFGQSKELSMSIEKSNKNYTGYNIDYYNPWIKGTDRVSWGGSIYKNMEGNDGSALFHRVDVFGVSVNAGKSLSRNWRLNLGARFDKKKEMHNDNIIKKMPSEDKYAVTDSSGTPIVIEGVDDKYNTVSVYPFLTYDTRNNFQNPTEGMYGRLRFEFGHSSGYNSGTFSNLTLEGRAYHKGFFKDNLFAYRVVGGVMSSSTKESQRFWLGGGNTIRGYDGGDFRGTKKLLLNVENRTQLHDLIGVVLFADVGRAWDQNGRDPSYGRDSEFPKDIAVGVGAGLRLDTPLGLLRFDFGWPVGKDRDKEMKFYFNVGQTF